MPNIQKLKILLDDNDFDDEVKSNIYKVLDSIESEIEELTFLNERYKRSQRVNRNFVKKTVELLEKSNEDLTKSNTQLTETNTQLTKSNEELERFAFIASHDLKTPLRNIISFAELLKRKLHTNNDKDIDDYLAFIIDGGKRMNTLIEDVLEYSKNSKQNRDDEFTTVSLEEVIEKITSSISQYINERNASIQVLSPLPSLISNQSKVFILFKNLIENGIKYNESSTPIIKIYCEYTKEQCRIFVEDNGIGISEKYFGKVFQMFTRLHNHSQYEGTGLGLSMCRKIVEELGGNIHLESQPEIKTIFRIDLPIEICLPNGKLIIES